MLGRAVRTWEKLIENGFETSVIDLWKIKPIDQEFFVNRLREYDNIVTLEEQTLAGGFGSAVLEMFADKGLTKFLINRIGIKNRFVEHGPQDVLRKDYEIDSAAILKAAIKLHGKKIK